ncbi:hypothetical protein [Streptomyces chiangmaiensis]|uniref:hypothetical protein n=1 Tax=Streptomyces chiangmaiensis TaxID=766497 RepID=UPI0031E9F892
MKRSTTANHWQADAVGVARLGNGFKEAADDHEDGAHQLAPTSQPIWAAPQAS